MMELKSPTNLAVWGESGLHSAGACLTSLSSDCVIHFELNGQGNPHKTRLKGGVFLHSQVCSQTQRSTCVSISILAPQPKKGHSFAPIN
eukprot:5590228-Amphidinium_carterae.3